MAKLSIENFLKQLRCMTDEMNSVPSIFLDTPIKDANGLIRAKISIDDQVSVVGNKIVGLNFESLYKVIGCYSNFSHTVQELMLINSKTLEPRCIQILK